MSLMNRLLFADPAGEDTDTAREAAHLENAPSLSFEGALLTEVEWSSRPIATVTSTGAGTAAPSNSMTHGHLTPGVMANRVVEPAAR
jgi:hypothetical protein